MKKPRDNFILISFLVPLFTGCATRPSEPVFTFQIPNAELPADVRVVGMSLTLTNACFASLPEIPSGWSFTIDNDPEWKGHLDGQIIVGAAALGKNDAFFQQPIRVRLYPNGKTDSANAECKIIFTTASDFDKEATNVVLLVPIGGK